LPLSSIKLTNFRCFDSALFEADPHYNLIYGANASGKTSLLEAISYLGRGKSFRGASTQNLIRHGESDFVLLGKIDNESRESTVGVRNSRDGLEIKIDGAVPAGAAALAESLPLLVVDPDVHNLVGGAPEERRRYIDWIAFHVEHGYLQNRRRFRRTLKQRNAALRDGAEKAALAGWDREFISAALVVDQARREIVDLAAESFGDMAGMLLGSEARLEYRSGWAKEQDLVSALAASSARDREQGTSHVGPHRSDLRLVLDERQARKVVSRGQQKLLACSLVLTAAELVQTHLERPLLLLLDDPAAELDSESLNRLMSAVMGLGSQVIATALAPDSRLFPEPPAMFHVERGQLVRAL
jgi:DNA replication and repair protein RecF